MKMCSERAGPVALERSSLNGATMGTRYTALFYAPTGTQTASLAASLHAAVDRVDRQMSRWNPASDLCRLNAAPCDTWLDLPPELAQVIDAGLQVGLQSDGAFDIALGEVVDAWGFGPSQRIAVQGFGRPGANALAPATALYDFDRAHARIRKRASATMDLSGIAKGYGVDALADCMDAHGIAAWLVGIDGEMRARGARADGAPWSVAIEAPTFGVREVAGVMELRDMAIATSGDYRRWVYRDGRRHSHTIDPRHGQPVSNGVAAVTVLAPTCMLADAWATAFMALGEAAGVALARARGIDALFVMRESDHLREVLVAATALAPDGR